MQKVFFVLFILLAGLSSCTTQNQNGIPVSNNLAFKTLPAEKELPLTAAAEQKYRAYFNNQPQNQIPLLRHIKHPDYELFIGLPFNTTFSRLKQSRTQTGKPGFSCSENMCTQAYQADSLQITEYLYQAPGQSVVFIAALSSRPQLPDSLFQPAALKQRFITIK